MILKQWYQAFKKTCNDGTVNFCDIMGENKTMVYFSPSILNLMDTYVTDKYCSGVIFGTGNANPTINDYKLSGDLVKNVSVAAYKTTTENPDGSEIYEATYTLNNNGNESVTIGEVGLCYKAHNTAYGSSGGGYALFERTTLESPITIEAGGVGQITYTIRMNYPTA